MPRMRRLTGACGIVMLRRPSKPTSGSRSSPRLISCRPVHPEVNTAWMWGGLLAATIVGWMHQLTACGCPKLRAHAVTCRNVVSGSPA
jgi:hypothetical protein